MAGRAGDRTSARRALDVTFRVEAAEPSTARYLDHLLRAFPASEHADLHYRIASDEAGGATLTCDGEVVASGVDEGSVAVRVVTHLNRRVAASDDHLLVHAAGCALDGVGVVLPGPMEAGKTTIVTALVRRGFGYLTDEAVAFDWATGRIDAYPKPLSIDPGSWPLFPDLEPAADLPGDGYKASQWQVAPDDIRPGAVASSSTARLVVFPRFTRDAGAVLEPVPRATALYDLAGCTFRFPEHGRRALDLLGAIVAGADCYRLATGDLAGAVDLVAALVDDVRAGASPGDARVTPR